MDERLVPVVYPWAKISGHRQRNHFVRLNTHFRHSFLLPFGHPFASISDALTSKDYHVEDGLVNAGLGVFGYELRMGVGVVVEIRGVFVETPGMISRSVAFNFECHTPPRQASSQSVQSDHISDNDNALPASVHVE